MNLKNINRTNLLLTIIIIILVVYGIYITMLNKSNTNILDSKKDILERISKIERLEEDWRTAEAEINIKRNEVDKKKEELSVLETQLSLMIKNKIELENTIHSLRWNVLKTEESVK